MRSLLALFRPPSPLALATRELEEAERSLLSAHSAAEYADAMVLYHSQRIERLRSTIREIARPEEPFPLGSDRFADE